MFEEVSHWTNRAMASSSQAVQWPEGLTTTDRHFATQTADARNTPHAFSHFTFEASGAEQIVVDIQGRKAWNKGGSKWLRLPRFSSRCGNKHLQNLFFWMVPLFFLCFFHETMGFFQQRCPGVDDLYTDPQIHTASSSTTRFGRGNMGLRGMALFFASHRYWAPFGTWQVGTRKGWTKREQISPQLTLVLGCGWFFKARFLGHISILGCRISKICHVDGPLNDQGLGSWLSRSSVFLTGAGFFRHTRKLIEGWWSHLTHRDSWGVQPVDSTVTHGGRLVSSCFWSFIGFAARFMASNSLNSSNKSHFHGSNSWFSERSQCFLLVGNAPKKDASIQAFLAKPFLFGDLQNTRNGWVWPRCSPKETEELTHPIALTYFTMSFFPLGWGYYWYLGDVTEVATVSATSWVWRRSLIRPCLVMALQPNTGLQGCQTWKAGRDPN